ncbi:hypothetical protein FMEAI12_3650018 [Parafrankia sp. Ea1.12]|nr:hypothetical protein FMEAI12_3650018 [Parafrankia sp. Ea1.12]
MLSARKGQGNGNGEAAVANGETGASRSDSSGACASRTGFVRGARIGRSPAGRRVVCPQRRVRSR